MIITINLIGCENDSNQKDISLLKKSVLKADANWQLFVDDYWIADSTNISVTLHQPTKHPNNPLIVGDVEWEETPYCFGTTIYDEEDSIFKLWYQSYNYDQPVETRTPILYATSSDGIEWERPNLGVIEFNGSKENNIILQNYGYNDLYSPSVIKDATDPDTTRRYKMIWWDYLGERDWHLDAGMCVAFSSDGIHWKKYSGNPVLRAARIEQSISDVMSVMHDKKSGKYVAYTKGWKDIDTPEEFRQIVRTESSDFIHWSVPEVVISHEHNLSDPQSYGMTTTQLGNNYFGLLHSYKKPGNETIDVQLTVSHDNKNWTRVATQQTFIPLGKQGSWDDGMIFTTPMINHGTKTLIYYSAWDGPHNTKTRKSGIGLATLRLNGFVSLSAKTVGSVTTHPMKNASGPLLVNADAVGGSLKAEILDTEGKPIPGYTMNDCLPIKNDDITQIIRWSDHAELPDSKNSLSIRFLINKASLFGFYAGADVVRADK